MGSDYLKDSQLKAIMPLCNPEKRKIYLPWINISMAYYSINTELRVSMYLAQIAHESTDLSRWVENLNYSAKRMTQVWPSRYPTISAAQPYAHNPQALANKSYNGRMGNRVGSNDGWTYRGRSPLQATGRDMYEAATRSVGKDFGVDFVRNPDLLLEVKYGFLVSAWIFAVEKRCLPLADAKNIRGCTIKINGGTTGLADRMQNYRTALSVLPDSFSLKSYDEFMSEVGAEAEQVASRSDNESRLDVSNKEIYTISTEAPHDDDSEIGDAEVVGEAENLLRRPDQAGTTSPDASNAANQPSGDQTIGTQVVVAGDEAEKQKIEQADQKPPVETKSEEKIGFWGKASGIVTGIMTGTYIIPKLDISEGQLDLIKLLLPYLAVALILALCFWYITKKTDLFKRHELFVKTNTDQTRLDLKYVDPPKTGLLQKVQGSAVFDFFASYAAVVAIIVITAWVL